MQGLTGRADFPTTRWTRVISCQQGSPDREAALQELLSAYWKPLYSFARRKGKDPHSAADVVQAFVLHLIEHDFAEKVDRQKGRMRAYLKTALSNFLINLHEHESAKKRGGERKILSLDPEIAEKSLPAQGEDPDADFDRAWATALMDRAWTALEKEFRDGKRQGPFELVEATYRFGEAPAQSESATRYDMSIPQIKSFLHRTRLRYKTLVQEAILDTVQDADSVEDELRDLIELLAP